MQVVSRQASRGGAESLIQRLVGQLHRQAVLDALLLCAPPALAGLVLVALLHHSSRIAPYEAIAWASAILVLAALAVFLRLRPVRPNARAAARLMDKKSGAQDHFLTLATIDLKREPEPFVARLRRQTDALGHRIELRRDFPYRFKRSAFWSLAISVLAAVLISLLVPASPKLLYRPSVQERLSELIERMATQPALRNLAQGLKELAVKLDEPKFTPAEKQAEIHQMEKRVEEQRAKEQQGDNRELLGQAAEALEGLEKEQQVASGQGQQQQEKGGGGIQTNAPQKGEGENQQSQGGSGESKGDDSSAQLSQEKMDRGNSAQANPKEQGQSKNQAADAKNNQNQPDPNNPSQEQTKQKAGKSQGDSKEGAGKQQASEEPPPPGGPQADRFYKPGEGKEGLAGKKGYVTVQLPEEVVADSKGESAPAKDGKNNRTRAKIPVSNVPLPAHVPNAPTEKQHVPLEYRGILR